MTDTSSTPPPTMPLLGWREWVSLPDLGVPWVKAKVDTGARTSALHAFDVEEELDSGVRIVRFKCCPLQKEPRVVKQISAELLEYRKVRSSDGKLQLRPVIVTEVSWGEHTFEVELTLTDRADMLFRMLLGRTAVRSRFLVDPHLSFLGGRPSSRRLAKAYPESVYSKDDATEDHDASEDETSDVEPNDAETGAARADRDRT